MSSVWAGSSLSVVTDGGRYQTLQSRGTTRVKKSWRERGVGAAIGFWRTEGRGRRDQVKRREEVF